MSNLRSGTYGNYYGSFRNESSSLTVSQMEKNALYIFSYLMDKGWSVEAISGVLGNMEAESALNPGRWQGDIVGNENGGYGLVQWTPATRHFEWCETYELDPSDMDSNLLHLNWEINDGDDYYSTEEYPESFEEFAESTKDPYYLACAFAWNYERSAVVLWGTEAEKEALRQQRGGAAAKWYAYLTGNEPKPPGSGGSTINPKRKKYNFILFGRKKWRFPA